MKNVRKFQHHRRLSFVGHINFVAQVVDKETLAIIFDTTCYCNTVTDKLDTYILNSKSIISVSKSIILDTLTYLK